MTLRSCAYFCLLAFVMLTAACAASGPNQGTSNDSTAASGPCDATYAYAPGAYIINIVSGDAVILDPLRNDFYVFCTPEAAKKHVEKRVANRELPPGDWKVYRVYGTWNDLATEIGPNSYLLNIPAPIIDWVN